MGGPNGNQTLKWCNVSVGLYQWNRRGPSNNPPHFPQVPTSRGEKQSERMSPEKAVGNLCCNICQDVVTCWCWNTTGSKVLLLFKWLVSLIWLISKFIRCCWKLTRCHSTATFLYTHCASSDFYSLGIVKYRLRRWTFPQLMPGIPSSGSCNCPVVFFLSGSCGSSGLWRQLRVCNKVICSWDWAASVSAGSKSRRFIQLSVSVSQVATSRVCCSFWSRDVRANATSDKSNWIWQTGLFS